MPQTSRQSSAALSADPAGNPALYVEALLREGPVAADLAVAAYIARSDRASGSAVLAALVAAKDKAGPHDESETRERVANAALKEYFRATGSTGSRARAEAIVLACAAEQESGPLSPEHQAELKQMIDQAAAEHAAEVARSRPADPNPIIAETKARNFAEGYNLPKKTVTEVVNTARHGAGWNSPEKREAMKVLETMLDDAAQGKRDTSQYELRHTAHRLGLAEKESPYRGMPEAVQEAARTRVEKLLSEAKLDCSTDEGLDKAHQTWTRMYLTAKSAEINPYGDYRVKQALNQVAKEECRAAHDRLHVRQEGRDALQALLLERREELFGLASGAKFRRELEAFGAKFGLDKSGVQDEVKSFLANELQACALQQDPAKLHALKQDTFNCMRAFNLTRDTRLLALLQNRNC